MFIEYTSFSRRSGAWTYNGPKGTNMHSYPNSAYYNRLCLRGASVLIFALICCQKGLLQNVRNLERPPNEKGEISVKTVGRCDISTKICSCLRQLVGCRL